MSQENAVSTLVAAGLRATITQVPSQAKLGTVVVQSPSPGRRVKKGATVQLTVSQGPAQVAVPGVVGMQSGEAQAALRGAGLVPVVAQVSAGEPRGTVVAQTPPPGAQVRPGSTVTISVSNGPGTTTPTTP
jgi:serine/threonine-protein kinase